jgi:hypothetical protein
MTSAAPDTGEPQARPATTPRGLLSTAAIAAIALGIAAFWLWGTNGEAWILDMIAAYCG